MRLSSPQDHLHQDAQLTKNEDRNSLLPGPAQDPDREFLRCARVMELVWPDIVNVPGQSHPIVRPITNDPVCDRPLKPRAGVARLAAPHAALPRPDLLGRLRLRGVHPFAVVESWGLRLEVELLVGMVEGHDYELAGGHF